MMSCEVLLDFLQPLAPSSQLRQQLHLNVPQHYNPTVHLCLHFLDLIGQKFTINLSHGFHKVYHPGYERLVHLVSHFEL